FRFAISARTARRAPSGERLAAGGRGPARGTSRAGSSRGGGALRGARRNVSRRAGLGGVARPLSRAEAASRGPAVSGSGARSGIRGGYRPAGGEAARGDPRRGRAQAPRAGDALRCLSGTARAGRSQERRL